MSATALTVLIIALAILALIVAMVGGSRHERNRIAEERRIADALRAKGLEAIRAPVSLRHGEVCYFWTTCDLVQLRRTRGAVAYHGLVARIKIADGVHYRAALLSGGIQLQEEFRVVDSGEVLITNKRVIYRGSKRNSSVTLDKALSIHCFEGGTLRIEKEKGSPFIVTSCPAVAMEAVFEMILGRPIQSSYDGAAPPVQPDLFGN